MRALLPPRSSIQQKILRGLVGTGTPLAPGSGFECGLEVSVTIRRYRAEIDQDVVALDARDHRRRPGAESRRGRVRIAAPRTPCERNRFQRCERERACAGVPVA